MGLTPEEIQALLHNELNKPSGSSKRRYPLTPQKGPLRWFDTSRRCVSRGCGSPTHCKVEGIPLCSMHALLALNNLCLEMQEVLESRGLMTTPEQKAS